MKPERRCKHEGCTGTPLPRLQRCYWHWLAKQPPVVRTDAAAARLALVPEELRVARIPPKKWPEGHRWCAGCQTFVPLEFAKQSRCRDCTSVAQHMARIKNEYDIDVATYHWLEERQLHRCAICRQRPVSKRLAVDHEHSSGDVRGLLCSACNHDLLKAARHSIEILENAVAYLKNPPMTDGWQLPVNELEAWRVQHGDGDVAPF
jgi:hypothetical protein